MARCFVMQPFDGGEFDRRFDEVYAPAIEEAGFEAYRVDRDPGASIPIQNIETEIKESAVCFVDISIDNPNVWFELGYAICAQKPICIVCSSERTKFPFDIQHRKIIKYKTTSPSDFITLKKDITSRLKALEESEIKIDTILAESNDGDISPLSDLEFSALCVIFENQDHYSDWIGRSTITNGMDRLGYTKLAMRASIERLLERSLISAAKRQDDASGTTYYFYRPTDEGQTYVMQNLGKVALKKPPSDIPF